MSTEVPARRTAGSTASDGGTTAPVEELAEPRPGEPTDTRTEVRAEEPPVTEPPVTEPAPPGRHWLSGRPFRRLHLLEAAVIALAVIALAYVFRSIVVPTDPWHYVRSAMYFPSDGWVALGYTRY